MKKIVDLLSEGGMTFKDLQDTTGYRAPDLRFKLKKLKYRGIVVKVAIRDPPQNQYQLAKYADEILQSIKDLDAL